MTERCDRGARFASIALLVVAACAMGARAARTEGFLEADEVAHYLYARHAPEHPWNFLHVWARPGFTAALMPFAQFGLAASRAFSVLCAVVAAGAAYGAARAFGWRTAGCAIAATVAQPLFFQQSAGIWTEVAFAALAGIWALCVASARPMPAAACAALLPLVRPEGFVVAAVTGIAAAAGALATRAGAPRRIAPLVVLPAGVVAWALAAFVASGDPLWVVHHWPPNWAPDASYGRGDWAWIREALPKAVPVGVLLACAVGCFAKAMRRGWPVVLAALLVPAVHAALWAFGAFGSAGYPRYFVTVAPLFGILAAGGVESVARLVPRIGSAAFVVAAGVAAAVFVATHPTAALRPPLPPDARLFIAVGATIAREDPSPVVYGAHPFAYLALDAVPSDRFDDFGSVSRATLAAAPAGAWAIVEDRFWLSPRPEGRGKATENPGEEALADLGYEKVPMPGVSVDLRPTDPRHDPAIATMAWAVYRKRVR